MKMDFTLLKMLLFLLMGSSAVLAQETKTQKEFRPVPIISDIDKPEGMAVIGDVLYIAQYHQSGSIVKYDLANRVITGKVTDGLNYPTGLLAYNDQLIVLEYGSGSLYSLHPGNGKKELIASGFSRPADVILFNDQLIVSDYGRGILYAVDPSASAVSVFASGLATPAGLAVYNEAVHVVEWGMGRISKIGKDGTKEVLVAEGLSSPWGLMVYENELYVAETGSNEISKISAVKIPVKDRTAESSEIKQTPVKDSITIWKVASMNCTGLQHPEAFSVSERGIYVSEWKSKEVSEILLNSPPTGDLVLTGKSKVGYVVTAEPKNIQDADGLGPFSYRWQLAGHPEEEVWTEIDGKKVEYKLRNERLAGKYIRAVLSYTDQAGFEETVYSNALLIVKPFAPEVALSFSPEAVFLPGDTVTLIAELTVLDEDATPEKVEFYCDGQQLVSVGSAPFRYRFVVQDSKAEEGYIDHLSIVAKGYDSNGLFGEAERTAFVTNEQNLESELQSLVGESEDIRIFPNPTLDILNIVLNRKESFKVRLIDLNENVVLSTVVKNGYKTLDLSKITPGIYILEYTIGTDTRAEKIIKL